MTPIGRRLLLWAACAGVAVAQSPRSGQQNADELWRFATLADGSAYWWRPSQLLGVSEPEVTCA